MLGILIGGCALFGLVVGSFLNVVIYRVPRNESIVSPPSHCPSCNSQIRSYDNVPVLSWLLLRGRCRNCRARVSPRYLVVEFTSAGLYAGLAARMGYNWSLPAFLVLFAGLLALACIDMEHLILPKRIIYVTFALVGLLLVLADGESHSWRPLAIAAICSAAWFALFFMMNFASPRILGFGDVRLALVLGLGLGWLGWRYVVIGFFMANFVGALIGLALIATKKMSRDQPIPYGVFLAAGTAIAVFVGPEVVGWSTNLHL